ncbi:MAG: hypothetical protein U5R14_07590 [Gemmatimonadota bacterium]|nr:hypothetical protein [Gemmatimonadota bacterium]
MRPPHRLRTLQAIFGGPLLALLLLPAAGAAQTSPADSAEIVDEMREMQEDFERFRESRIPVEVDRTAASCDERIGRICIWFGGDDEADIPGELREVRQARVELIRALADASDRVADPWVLGQRVHYLVENRDMGEAERVAIECGIAETWWCSALLGYVYHVWTRYIESERAFREALAAMPGPVREEWTTPRYVFTSDGVEAFRDAPLAERERQWELLWRLSDPLFLFEGNDRLTDHYARLVVAENRRDAAHPQDLEWDDDLEESLVRYGRNTGYSRTHDPARASSPVQDTRRVVGHHHPMSRGYLFPETFLASPSDIPPESWITAPREARTWYAPPYAPDIRGLETQVGRFRRGDEMLVVGAYRPTVEGPSGRAVPAWEAAGAAEEPAGAALFLVPEDGGEMVYVQGDDPEGVLAMQAEPGRYVSSLEVVNPERRRAWRARQGVAQQPLAPGLVGVSDLMLLREDAPLPESLAEAIPNVRPGIRVRAGERFPVIWEVYGLAVREPVRVTIGFSGGRPGFLERVGAFLGVIEPERNIDITFDETGPEDRVQSVFRSIELELPELEPGEYTLHLRLELSGRDPVVTSRPIVVVAALPGLEGVADRSLAGGRAAG